MTPKQKARYRLNLYHLQTQCGENYLRLVRLLRACERNSKSLSAADLVMSLAQAGHVHLSVTGRSRYTTDMTLTQHGQHPLQGNTRLAIRLYHDAHLAEVTGIHPYQRTQACNPYPNDAMHQPDEKHQWNLFLGEWLTHLERHGQPQVRNWRAQVSRHLS